MVTFDHERVTAVELRSKNGSIIIINAYFPYFNTRDLTTYTALYRDTVGQIDNIMHSNPGCLFIIAADFNCYVNDQNHPYSSILRDLMS